MLTHRLAIVALVATAACSSHDETTLTPRTTTSAALDSFVSCDDLLTRLQANLREEAKTQLLQYLDSTMYSSSSYAEDDVSASSADSESPQEGVDYSGTNNQESGVDEGDFVKTDGTHVYILNGDSLVIVAVPEFGKLEQSGTLLIEGYPQEMLVSGSTAVVFSQIYPQYFGTTHPLYAFAIEGDGRSFRTDELVKMTFVDVSDPAHPVATRELYIEGYYSTSRKIDSSVRVISFANIYMWDLVLYPEYPENYWNLDQDSAEAATIRKRIVTEAIAKNDAIIEAKPLSDFIPNLYTRHGGLIVPESFSGNDCSNFAIADDGLSHGVTSVVSFDVAGEGYQADHIVSNSSVVYASADTLVVAEPSWNWWWYYGQDDDADESTNLHRFDISVAGATTYTGSGRVDGTVANQFDLSEKDGIVRVATTSNAWSRWWVENPPPVSSNVFALNGDLAVVGSLTGISPGEQLFAARFVDDKAYLVTARNVDPLWTIDVSDPTHLVLQSELEVPGVSTYVQPLEGERLLSIGYAGDTQIDWSTTQLSLFDVSGVARLAATLQFGPPSGSGWTYSEAQYQHKAFQYWAPKGLLAIPLSSYSYNSWGYGYYSGLVLVSVAADGLSEAARIDHSAYFDDPTVYWSNPSIRRTIFMGDYVVAISARAITATHLGDFVESALVRLPGDETPYWYY